MLEFKARLPAKGSSMENLGVGAGSFWKVGGNSPMATSPSAPGFQ